MHEGGVLRDEESKMDWEEFKKYLLGSEEIEEVKLSVCVTMYNEPFSQLLESVAGIYRAYYELVEISEDF